MSTESAFEAWASSNSYRARRDDWERGHISVSALLKDAFAAGQRAERERIVDMLNDSHHENQT